MDEVCRASVALGHLYADAVATLLHRAGIRPERVAVIGCHGQTVRHLPHPESSLGREVRATMQLGDAATLAERTGITVVSNFRARDIAAGGQGAPLVPLFDFLFLADRNIGRIALNIGGIANVTLLPPSAAQEDVIAFDTGPGNILIDLLAARITSGAQFLDRDGDIAATGSVDESLLGELLEHPYLKKEPPKSTGREEFGEAFLDTVSAGGTTGSDLIATLTAFSAHSIAHGIERFRPRGARLQEIVVSGGGVHNKTLMRMLQERLSGMVLRPIAEFGIDPDFKEAIAFAVIADRTLRGLPGNLPSATGAVRPVILGQITKK